MRENTNRRVLVVDDNDAIHADFQKILGGSASDAEKSLQSARNAFLGGAAAEEARSAFEMETATQGEEGVARVVAARDAGRPFAVAFVDVRMPPGIDGVQTIKRLWQSDPDLQVVICTAYADYSLEQITQELGNSDKLLILKKPFDPVEVRQLSSALTEKWSSARRERERMEEVERYAASLEESNRALQEANARAEAATRVKSEFLANMSHEIRTPMTSILGYIELLFDADVSTGEREQYREIIRRSGQHLLVIINDILDLSKIEAGRLVLLPEEFDPRELLRDVVGLHEHAAAQKGLRFEATVGESVPDTVHNDPVRVRQVLSNLIANAIKFTRQGAVRVHLDLEGDEGLRFDVIDTGIGIEPAALPVLFDAFTQADSSSTRMVGGTGLGLAISKQLAIMLGGDIEVVSEPGDGSKFTLHIAREERGDGAAAEEAPARTAEGARLAPEPPRTVPASLDLRMLLVEDGRLNQVLIRTILAKAGAEVDVADNGEEGCQRVAEAARAGAPYDVVLMDMQMPVLDGYDAARRLRAAGIRTPIIALTAHAMAGDRQKCLDAGCTDYATKPVDRKALLALCHKVSQEPSPPAPLPAGRRSASPAPAPDEV